MPFSMVQASDDIKSGSSKKSAPRAGRVLRLVSRLCGGPFPSSCHQGKGAWSDVPRARE